MDLTGPMGRIESMKRRAFLVAAAAPLVAAAVPRSLQAARAGGGVVALATADLESHLVAVSPTRASILKRIATAPGQRSIEAGRFGQALVAHTGHGRLTVVDTADLDVLGEIGGPRRAALRGDAPVRAPRVRERLEAAHHPSSSILSRRAVVTQVAVPGPARHSLAEPGRRCPLGRARKHGRRASPFLDAYDAGDRSCAARSRRRSSPTTLSWAPGESTCGSHRARAAARDLRGSAAKPVATLPAGAPPQHVAFPAAAPTSRAATTAPSSCTASTGRPAGLRASRSARTNVSLSDPDLTFGRRLGVTPSLDRGTVCLFTPAGEVRHGASRRPLGPRRLPRRGRMSR
jgi:hypothetical protein